MRTKSPCSLTTDRDAEEAAVPASSIAPSASVDTAPHSRRGFLTRAIAAAIAAASAATIAPAAAQAQAGRVRAPRRPSEPSTVVNPLGTIQPSQSATAFAEWNTGGLSRLVRRVTQGMTANDVQLATQLGWSGYLEHQLNYEDINDDALESEVEARWPLMSQESTSLVTADGGVVKTQLIESTIYRAAFSQRQLYERMVEFWSDHFNQDYDKVGYLLVADQRDVIREHALGKFPDLLKASAHSAAMMLYLDQNASRKGAPNQNYAREIMELHTLGVDGGYTQNDVAELSRVLTGWTFDGKSGAFLFSAANHDTGSKTVLGITIAGVSGADGISEGEKMLDVLTTHPSTAKFIATKLLKWMLTPTPTDQQISAISAVYRATGGDIKMMLRAILNDSWLPVAPMKLKRPFQYLVSALRGTSPTIVSIAPMNSQLNALGHPIFSWDTPDGFPDKMEYWSGNLVPRWAFGNSFANLNSATTLLVDIAPYRAGSPANAIDLIDQNFFGGEMPTTTKTALNTYIIAGTFTDARVREAIGLAIAANGFQWY